MHSKKNKSMAPAVTGIAAVTLAAGTAAYVMNARSMKGTRKVMKRSAGKAAKVVGQVVDSVVDNVASNILG
ncbi:MAG: hypothetical protein VB100_04180 [Angelakisella sp.]|nr:hypothetical protein [Angelakisella sp.]